MDNNLEGRFWMSKQEHSFLGRGRIELLLRIQESGSITQAAKMMKMSYKAAWDAVDAMNNLSEYSLVLRSKGGKGGGGTHITEYAKELIATYKILEEEHTAFLNNLSQRISQEKGHFRLLESMNVRMSARNQLKAKVIEIQKGVVESEIFLQLHGEDIFMAIITNDSLDALDLKVGTEVHALFKANAVVLSTEMELKKSGRNRFVGNVSRISRGNFDAEVVITLGCANTICSTMPMDTLEELQLKNGMQVVGFCKPKSIMIGIW
ncbi:TOBE domain-containing protein [bacterium]|nr:TOBE domain-containing protein [bacterium]MBU1994902.1 TOBE domain-containing protein [bacterium]